jgi:hypothetical protein
MYEITLSRIELHSYEEFASFIVCLKEGLWNICYVEFC